MSSSTLITVRLQTNLSTRRLQVSGDSTAEQLKELVVAEFHITNPSALYFSKEKDKTDFSSASSVLEPHRSLASQGVTNGAFLYILGKLNTKVVEKTHINSDVSVLQKCRNPNNFAYNTNIFPAFLITLFLFRSHPKNMHQFNNLIIIIYVLCMCVCVHMLD